MFESIQLLNSIDKKLISSVKSQEVLKVVKKIALRIMMLEKLIIFMCQWLVTLVSGQSSYIILDLLSQKNQLNIK